MAPKASTESSGMGAVVAVAALCALAFILYTYSSTTEGLQVRGSAPVPMDPVASSHLPLPTTVSDSARSLPSDCFPKDRLVASDLLPKDAANDLWSRVNPAGQGGVDDKNFLTAGYHTGLNTVSSSLRNPSLQIRSEPPNPRSRVSVWNQSTIEPDLNRRPFEIDH